MAWPREEEQLCLQPYDDMYVEAIANEQKHEAETDHNMWAERMNRRGRHSPLLQRVVLAAFGFSPGRD